jgi:hypothetical protein
MGRISTEACRLDEKQGKGVRGVLLLQFVTLSNLSYSKQNVIHIGMSLGDSRVS